MKYRDEKFYWSYQRGVHWPDDYIGPDSMTNWIMEGSVGFTDVGLLRISESVRAYAYLILSSQASARSGIIGNTVSALTAQSPFFDNFEDIVNRRVDIREVIKHYQDTLSYASSKVDYSVAENIYMLPSDMNLKIRSGTVGYNNKILVSDGKFSLGKNNKVNYLALGPQTLQPGGASPAKTLAMRSPTMESHKNSSHSNTTQELMQNKLSLKKRKELL